MTTKLIVKLLFLLLPVCTFCQTTEEYGALGPVPDSVILPSFNRKWTAKEFEEVFKLMIAQQKDTTAPVITMANSKALLEKVTDYQNYWFLNSSYHNLNDRFTFNLSLQAYLSTIAISYYQKSKIVNGKMLFEKEIAAFYALMYNITQNQLELADEFTKANPNLNEVQRDGLKKMIHGGNTMISGGLTTFKKEYTYFSAESVCHIATAFNHFYLTLQPKIDQTSQTEFAKRIDRIIKTHPLPCLKDALQSK